MDVEEGSSPPSKPPPKKVGFKGKRAKAKFTRNGRTGAQQKARVSRQRHIQYVAALAAASPPSATVRAAAAATSNAAISSPTKKEFKAALRRHVKELRRVSASNQLQLKKNCNLKRKLEEKEETIMVATRQNSIYKAALKTAEKAKARVEVALHREMSFRAEDASISQAKALATKTAFDRERDDFSAALKKQQEDFELLLKEAVLEAKVSNNYFHSRQSLTKNILLTEYFIPQPSSDMREC